MTYATRTVRLDWGAGAEVVLPGPGSIGWKINREVVTVLGWGRAILLQLAHPLVAAGVADHSTFRTARFGGFGRLHSTIGAMLALTFGSPREVLQAARHIRGIHDRVHGVLDRAAGPFPAGTPYSAHDPELLCWVHATLLDSLPLAYELFVGPLSAAEKDRYCAEATVMGPLLGMPIELLPKNTGELRQYMAQMFASRAIVVTDTARELARDVLYPAYGWIVWPAMLVTRLTTIGLLPPDLRGAYGFRWTPTHARALHVSAALIRSVRRVLPRVVREWRH